MPVTLARTLREVVAVVDAEVAAQELGQGQEGRGLAVGHRARLEHPPAGAVRAEHVVRMGELVEEPRLADPCLADHGDELAPPLPGLRGRVPDLVHLRVPANEAAEATGPCGLQARPDGAGARQLEHLHGRGEALDGNGPERAYLHELLGELQRLGGEPGRAGRGELLHARGEVCRLPDRRVVHAQVAAHRADHHVAGVDPDADLDLDAVGAPHVLRIAPDRLVHAQGRVTRAHGVVLVGERRAEERHDAVAHDLIHRALVAVDSFHHSLEHRVEDSPRLLRVAVGEKLHRALHVGEEDGDLLALALEGRLRGEDALGEVLRCVGVRRAEAAGDGRVGSRRDAGRDRAAALTTELLAHRADGAAGGTAAGQARAALAAELLAAGVLVPALRAGRHRDSLARTPGGLRSLTI